MPDGRVEIASMVQFVTSRIVRLKRFHIKAGVRWPNLREENQEEDHRNPKLYTGSDSIEPSTVQTQCHHSNVGRNRQRRDVAQAYFQQPAGSNEEDDQAAPNDAARHRPYGELHRPVL